jgi:hypothetical protein
MPVMFAGPDPESIVHGMVRAERDWIVIIPLRRLATDRLV